MSKDRLLSDEELLKIIRQHPEHMNATEKGYGGYTAEDLLAIINTQKRLYAESVIGEDEEELNQFYYVRNELRAEQRKRVNDEHSN